jgi:tetratricopeptide (TPR) repeat protein
MLEKMSIRNKILIPKILGFLLVLASIVLFILGFNVNSEILIISSVVLFGVFSGYYFIGRKFLKITVPIPKKPSLSDRVFEIDLYENILEKMKIDNLERFNELQSHKYRFYEELKLNELFYFLKNYKKSVKRLLPLLINILCMILIVLFISSLFWNMNIAKIAFNQVLSIGILILIGIIFILIISFLVLYLLSLRLKEDKSSEGVTLELKQFLALKSSKMSFRLAMILFLAYFTIGFLNGWLSIGGGVISLFFFLPLFVLVQLMGKHFPVFFLHQWYISVMNWDYFEGREIIPSQEVNWLGLFKGYLRRGVALIALGGLFVGLISPILKVITIITTTINNLDPITTPGFLDNFSSNIAPPLSFFLIFIIGLGPLLSLFINPFDNIKIWLHQGIYEKMNSNWSIEELKANSKKYEDVVRFPTRHITRYYKKEINKAKKVTINFLLLIGGLTVIILLLTYFTGISQVFLANFPYINQGLWFANQITDIIYLFTVIQALRSLEEEKTLLKFIQASKKLKRDLLNETINTEYLLHKQKFDELEDWINSFDEKDWGVPFYFRGLRLNPIVFFSRQSGGKKNYIMRSKKIDEKQLQVNLEKEFKWYQIAISSENRTSLPQQMLIATLINCGIICRKLSMYKLGIGYYNELASFDSSKRKIIHEGKAYCYHKLGQLEKGEDEYKKALQLDNEFAEALYNYAGLLCSKKEIDKAFIMFKRSFDKDDRFLEKALISQDVSCLLDYDPFQKFAKENFKSARRGILPKLEQEVLKEIDSCCIIKIPCETSLPNGKYPREYGYTIESGHIVGLSLNHKQLDKIPKGINNLHYLKSLNLANNALKSLPISFDNLVELEELFLYQNPLKSLPESIGDLVKLKILALGFELLDKLPKSIINLKNLETFQVVGSPPSFFPELPEWYKTWKAELIENGCSFND